MTIVAVAGFFHETNTFSPYPGDLDAFRRPATLPGLTLGDDIPARFAGLNVPVSGAMQVLAASGVQLAPIAWASAVPCGRVTRDAFETIAGMIVDGIGRPDGVYLDLHGAMVAAHLDDPELELIRRVRDRVGPDVPIVASFDLHANLSAARVAALDGLAIFRTYPHLDMAETGARAARLLLRRMAGKRSPMAFRALPFQVPLHAQDTGAEPARGLYVAVERIARETGMDGAELALGFPPGDVPHRGPAIVTIGERAEAGAAALERLALAAAADFVAPLPDAAETVRLALAEAAASGHGPVVIADTQDNPGAGGTGDTVGLLLALLNADVADAVLALLHDPEAARLAHAVGVGATARFRLGAHSGTVAETPVEAEFVVETLTDGQLTAVGPMYRGNRWDIGATAVLRRGGVRVMVAERRLQAADSAVLRHAGLAPEAHAIVVLKSSVHFRAEYEAIARRIIVAAAPGLHLADPGAYAYRTKRIAGP